MSLADADGFEVRLCRRDWFERKLEPVHDPHPSFALNSGGVSGARQHLLAAYGVREVEDERVHRGRRRAGFCGLGEQVAVRSYVVLPVHDDAPAGARRRSDGRSALLLAPELVLAHDDPGRQGRAAGSGNAAARELGGERRLPRSDEAYQEEANWRLPIWWFCNQGFFQRGQSAPYSRRGK